MPAALCFRRSGKYYRLCGAFCVCDLYEHLFLRALSDDLLSLAAVQCRDGNEEWDVSDRTFCDVLRLLFDDAAASADLRIRSADDCILCAVLHRGVCSCV